MASSGLRRRAGVSRDDTVASTRGGSLASSAEPPGASLPAGHSYGTFAAASSRDDVRRGRPDANFSDAREYDPLLASDAELDEISGAGAGARAGSVAGAGPLALGSYVSSWWARIAELFWAIFPSMPAPEPERVLPLDVLRRVDVFRQFSSLPYDSANPAMEQMLALYWQVAFPSTALDARLTKQWGQLGFQGKDPATDFRSAGFYGLCVLTYFAVEYTAAVRAILARIAATDGYPFSIAGLSILMTLLNYLGIGRPIVPSSAAFRADFTERVFAELSELSFDSAADAPAPAPAPRLAYATLIDIGGDSPAARVDAQPDTAGSAAPFGARALVHRKTREPRAYLLEELFVCCMFVLDETWHELNATYMDFPRVLAESAVRFQALVPRLATLDAVRAFNRERAERAAAHGPAQPSSAAS